MPNVGAAENQEFFVISDRNGGLSMFYCGIVLFSSLWCCGSDKIGPCRYATNRVRPALPVNWSEETSIRRIFNSFYWGIFAMFIHRVLYLLGRVILVITMVLLSNYYNPLPDLKRLLFCVNRLLYAST